MKSLRSNEGYLMLDHRHSPGLPEEQAAPYLGHAAFGRGLFEAPTYTCHHCQKVCIVKLPRVTEVPYCASCDHHICGTCGQRKAAGLACKPWKQIMDEALELAGKGMDPMLAMPAYFSESPARG